MHMCYNMYQVSLCAPRALALACCTCHSWTHVDTCWRPTCDGAMRGWRHVLQHGGMRSCCIWGVASIAVHLGRCTYRLPSSSCG